MSQTSDLPENSQYVRALFPNQIKTALTRDHIGDYTALSKLEPSVSESSLRRFLRGNPISYKKASIICYHLVPEWSPELWDRWLAKVEQEASGKTASTVEGNRPSKVIDSFSEIRATTLKPTKHNLFSLIGAPLIGQGALLENIHAALATDANEPSVAIAALRGMPCVGKSAIALYYAHKYLEDYPGGVCWVHAAGGELGRQIVQFLVDVLDLKIDRRDQPLEMQLQYCWHHWPGEDDPVLIIVDDIENTDQLTSLLKGVGKRFKFLLTSRQQLNYSTVPHQIVVNPLETEDAVKLFRTFLEGDPRADEDIQDIQQLCTWLGNLPLPIKMVADYMRIDPAGSAQEIYEQLQSNRFDDDALMDEVSDAQAQRGLAGAFALSWQRLSEDAQHVGQLLGLFAPKPFPWSLVEASYPKEDWVRMLRPARSFLLRFHFLAYDRDSKTYSINRLLQAFLRDRAAESDSEESATRAANGIAAMCRDVPDAFTKARLQACKVFRPHIEEVVMYHTGLMEAADALLSLQFLSRIYRDTGDPVQAKQLAEQAVSIARERFGERDLNVADALLEIAFLECSLRHPKDALEILQQVEPILEDFPDLGILATARMRYYRATAYRLQRQWPLAIQEAQEALKLREELLDSNDPRVTEVKVAIAAIRAQQEEPAEELEAMMVHLVEQRRQDLETSGNLHLLPEVLDLLARTYQKQSKLEQAIPLFEEAVEISEELYGKKHPQTAFGYNNLAKLQQAMGQMDIAEERYKQAIEILSAEPQDMTAPAAKCQHNLGVLLSEQGQYEKAITELEIAYETMKQSLPEGHEWVEQCYKDLEALKTRMRLG